MLSLVGVEGVGDLHNYECTLPPYSPPPLYFTPLIPTIFYPPYSHHVYHTYYIILLPHVVQDPPPHDPPPHDLPPPPVVHTLPLIPRMTIWLSWKTTVQTLLMMRWLHQFFKGQSMIGEGVSQWCGRRGCVPVVWLERACPSGVVGEGVSQRCGWRVCPSGVVGEGVSQWCGWRGHVPVVW